VSLRYSERHLPLDGAPPIKVRRPWRNPLSRRFRRFSTSCRQHQRRRRRQHGCDVTSRHGA